MGLEGVRSFSSNPLFGLHLGGMPSDRYVMAMDSFTFPLGRGWMKSHLVLLRTLLAEAGSRCCTSTSLDWKTIEARVKDEGLSFLTITLPQFGKDLLRALDQGVVDSTVFVGYSKTGCLPRLFSGFTSQVFDRKSGCLLEGPSLDAIHCILQLTQLMGKVELPCSDARIKAAFEGYLECENNVKENDATLVPELLHRFERMALLAWGDIMAVIDKIIFDGDILPRHGPGATADRVSGNRKYDQQQWTHRLEQIFPSGDYLFPSWSHFCDHEGTVDIVDPGSEIPVRVITVPKTLKTPRIIAVEPVYMQYAQQGILRELVSRISGDDTLGNLVGFLDQTPNQRLAQEGSQYGRLATLDLSEASDRVSNQLVKSMTRHFPWFSMALEATRSTHADVPGYGVIPLAKFASMGSALCFPIEAMVFLTIILLGVEEELKHPLSKRELRSLIGKVRVYGDDIIVPVEYVHTVVRLLTAFGLKVNDAKSFWTGKFRESCGKEYYDGFDVSIVKLRRMFPTQRQHAQEMISLVSFRNQLYKAGWWETCKYLDDYIRGLIPFPVVAETSPALGRHSFLGYETQKECPHLQRPLVRAFKARGVIPKSNLDGYGALLKFFLSAEAADRYGDPDGLSWLFAPKVDEDHLERAGRPRVVDIKLGWVPSY